MPYVVCVNKASPCCVLPFSAPSSPFCARTLEVYGCSPDLTQGEKGCCCQGNTQPAGCCCAWTVPAGVTRITVELWGGGGGGGSGAAANCCSGMPGGGGGTWVQRTFAVAPGDIMTLCAGQGGCSGGGVSDQQSYCCCGAQGCCSFVMRNGNVCADSWGGRQGVSQCYYHCGCTHRACGACFGAGDDPTGDHGNNQGCTGYTRDMISSATPSVSPGCGGNCTAQSSLSGGSPFGADGSWKMYRCDCWAYIRFNTSCTNSAGVAGIGGDPGPSGQAYNIPGTAWYSCSTSGFASCERHNPTPPGNFPGGGGAAGHSSGCCFKKTSGGQGAPGYIRVWF